MGQPPHVEVLLEDAIGLLEDNGFPLAAENLRDNLRAIRTAPTGGARRRRLFQLGDLLEGLGSTLDIYVPHGQRLRRIATNRRDQERYRRTLESIQEILELQVA